MAEQSQGEQYSEVESKFFSYKTAQRINNQTRELRKKNGQGPIFPFTDKTDEKKANFGKNVDSFSSNIDKAEENFKNKYKGAKDKLKKKAKAYKTQSKPQLNSLVDLAIRTLDKPTGPKAVREVRGIFVRAIKNTRNRIRQILREEVINAVGCSQDQTYTPGPIFIPVSSIDVFGKTLQYSPDEEPGKYLYETKPFSPSFKPYSVNRELFNRLQKEGQSYSQEYNTLFLGTSNQPLFDLTYVKKDDKNNQGDFFRVDLQFRQTGDKVVEFIGDYYSSIDVINIKETYANVLNALTGVLDFSKGFTYDDSKEQKRWEIIIQKMLGMCYDNNQEIDVTGVGKLDPLDQVDSDLDEMDETDELAIEEGVKNFLAGVVEYADCNNVKFPITNSLLPKVLEPFDDENLVLTNPDFVAENMLNTLAQNPQWKAKIPSGFDLSDVIDKEYMRVIMLAIVNTILSPKHLLPLIVMYKALNPEGTTPDGINAFVKFYKKFLMNIVAKISTIFVEELLKEIKKTFQPVVQQMVNDHLEEVLLRRKRKIANIVLIINFGLTVAQGVQDFKRCKNVIDELNRLLSLAQRLIRLNAPPSPLWNTLAYLKPGMSASSMLSRYIEELEKNGMDTGDQPDGSPNFALINKRGEMKSHLDEQAENGRTSVAITGAQVAGLIAGAPALNLWGGSE